MANGDQVRVEYPEGDYSADIKRTEDDMAENARGMQRSSGFWSRGFAPEMYEGYKKRMQEDAAEGLRLRASRKRLHELGDALGGAASEPAKKRSTKRPAAKKRD